MLDRGEILEHDCYCGNFYGTPRASLDERVSRGIDILLDITVPGSLSVMRNYPEAITVFLLPPSFSELSLRLQKRGTEDSEGVIQRLVKAREEISKTNLFTYVVINDDLVAAAHSILAIAEAEHCRYKRLQGLEDTILAR
jgi:guanylate kinase